MVCGGPIQIGNHVRVVEDCEFRPHKLEFHVTLRQQMWVRVLTMPPRAFARCKCGKMEKKAVIISVEAGEVSKQEPKKLVEEAKAIGK